MFKSGSPVKGKDFIDRKKHLPLFKAYLDNNQHIMIKAPRRFGKTSLIKQIFEHEKNYEFIYIDIRLATSIDTLAHQILNKAYKIVKIENFIRNVKESLYDLLQSIKKVQITDIAELSIDYVTKESSGIELFIHALDSVNKIAASKGINIKIIFDEFQDIINLYDKTILETIRSVAQHHENLTYVFLGSIESIMSEIFESKSSAFFHFANVIHLQGLDQGELLSYTLEQFNTNKITYDKEALFKTIEFLEGHPEYSSKVLQTLYIEALLEQKKITYEDCIDAISFRVIENRAYLDEIISKVKQKKYHFEELYKIANDEKSSLNSATLYNTRFSLENMGLIVKVKKGKYKVIDIFLKILLQQKDSELLALENRVMIAL